MGIPEGAEFASQALCGPPRIKTYSADPHKSRSDPNQNCRSFLLVGDLLRSNGSCLRGGRLSERHRVGAIIESGI